ncbi:MULTISPECIES: hypothetical protein [Bacillus subtilis group]|uniref:hypothetical protein n=1 Tax=Bacillus subtilis group TaxID=653685 RepID=UPI00165B25F3|nr:MULTISPECIES: hypothetical protein [Bacillus subtilis group]MCY7876558.1 hypothetical protein [Bacillus spizizenii]MCY9089352.1 hypothetical protein [Bacillus mojavensis]MEC1445306.1 hypothetical protein [Bacillus subtilis]MEC1664489.1 hypothetical protein [Bacillus halotolerans]
MYHLNTRRGTKILGAINIQLTPAELRELETNFSKVKVHGGRTNEIHMQSVEQSQQGSLQLLKYT